MERSKTGMKERSPDGLSLPNQNIMNTISKYFTINGKKSSMKFNEQNALEQLETLKSYTLSDGETVYVKQVQISESRRSNGPPGLINQTCYA